MTTFDYRSQNKQLLRTIKLQTKLTTHTIAQIPNFGPTHITALTIPYCLDDRVSLMTRFCELSFLNDAYNNQLQAFFSNNIDDSQSPSAKSQQIQVRLLFEMLDVDHTLAVDLMATYSRALQAPNPPKNKYYSFYYKQKFSDIIPRIFQDMCCFGMGLKLSEAEKKKLEPIIDACHHSTLLINDYWSWPREVNKYFKKLVKGPTQLPLNAAQQRVLDEVVNQQEIHLRMIKDLEEQEGPLCERFRRYLLAVQHTASGSEYWSSHSTRYPEKHDYEQATTGSRRAAVNLRAIAPTSMGCRTGSQSSLMANGPSLKKPHEPHNGLKCEFVQAPDNIVLAPYQYLATLPSKNIRDKFIDALNIWLQVPRSTLSRIKKIITLLHHASLMVDDIEDNSVLRRGKPSTHILYGEAQTINSANHAFVSAFAEVQHLCHPSAPAVFVREVQNMHCGQALDLSWKYDIHCPTVDEYMMMIDNKTGAMFRLCIQLMQGESSNPCNHVDPNHLVTQLGRYFQIRDDHQNLVSAEYTDQKGFCEDLDEGKISLPLIYTLSNPKSEVSIIKGILQNRSKDGLPVPVKKYILEQMEKAGALEATLALAKEMQSNLMSELHKLEDAFGSKNPLVEMILRRLWV
ncbi:isoprenoid synthase domain-containing protein [Aspergillus filifer]